MEYEVTVHECDNCIVRIHRPILTDEERKRREDEAKKVLVEFYKEMRKKDG